MEGSIRIRKATSADVLFLAEAVFFAYEGHKSENGEMRRRMPNFSDAERIAVIAEAVGDTSPGGENKDELPGIVADNFIVAETESGELAGALCCSATKRFPNASRIMNGRVFEAIARRDPGLAEQGLARRRETTWIWALFKERHEFELEIIYVRPQFRGKGVLDAMLEEGYRRAKEEGYNEVILVQITDNAPAAAAYEKRGFSEFFSFSFPALRNAGVSGFMFRKKTLSSS